MAIPKLISANIKGGSGKTMTSFNLAGYLSDRGLKVLCIDCDPQSNLTTAFRIKPTEEDIYALLLGEKTIAQVTKQPYPKDTALKNIYVIPGCFELNFYEKEDYPDILHLTNILSQSSIEDTYDIVLIDVNPALLWITYQAYAYADLIIGVMDRSMDAIEGFEKLNNRLVKVYQKSIPERNLDILGILLNDHDRRKNISKEILNSLQKTYKNLMFEAYISDAVILEECRLMQIPFIAMKDKNFQVDSQYSQLTAELIKRLEQKGWKLS